MRVRGAWPGNVCAGRGKMSTQAVAALLQQEILALHLQEIRVGHTPFTCFTQEKPETQTRERRRFFASAGIFEKSEVQIQDA